MRSRPLLLGLLVAALAGVVIAVAWRRPPTGANTARPNILVIDIDTFRADHLGGERDGTPVTPNLDALARRGARFTQAYSHSGWTLPALVSTLTGVLPVVVAADDGAVAWRPAGTRDLAEILKLYGYTTAAFWGSTIPGAMNTALSTAFDTNSAYAHRVEQPPTEDITAFLADSPGEPFFVYVHDIDLHHTTSYATGRERLELDKPTMPLGDPSFQEVYERVGRSAGREVAVETMLARYDAMIHRYDEAVGQVLAALAEAGLDDHTIVVITSDHGEDFTEHAVAEHGLLYDTTLHVPLIVYDPQGPAGVTIDTMVQGVDLAPTLLSRVGIPVDAGMDGRSYLSLLGHPGAPYQERALFSLTEACHVSLRTPTAKLILRDRRKRFYRMWQPPGGKNEVIVTLADVASGDDLGGAPLADCSGLVPADAGQGDAAGPGPSDISIELYDLVADPGEYTNLVAERPEDVKALLVPLLYTLDERRRALTGAPREALTPAQIDALKQNGYWGLLQPGGDAAGEPPPN